MPQYHLTIYYDTRDNKFHYGEWPLDEDVWDTENGHEWRPHTLDEDQLFIEFEQRLKQLFDRVPPSITSEKW